MQQLPAPLLAHILHLVPCQQRVRAALVCSEWSKAVAACTTQLVFEPNAAAGPGLNRWARKHAAQLEFIDLKGKGMWLGRSWVHPWQQLPWTHLTALQTLVLRDCQLESVPSTAAQRPLPTSNMIVTRSRSCALGGLNNSSKGGAPARSTSTVTNTTSIGTASVIMTPLLPQLKQLELKDVKLFHADDLQRLASNPGLTKLLVFPGRAKDSYWQDSAAWCRLVQPLTALKVLELLSFRVHYDIAPHVAAMHQLQDLHLSIGGGGACGPSSFANLPSTLTAITFTDYRGFGEATLPAQLPQLSRLQHLDLYLCRIPPTLLRSMPAQLTHLELTSCHLLPCGLDRVVQPEGVLALLGTLQRLTQLRVLQLARLSIKPGNISVQQFSALTASTHLTRLFLQPAYPYPLVPRGALQHMFPAGRQLPHLKWLHLSGPREHEDEEDAYGYDSDDDDDAPPSPHSISGQDLARIVSSCPSLDSLCIANDIVEPGADLSPLKLASGLRLLSIGGDAFTDATAPLIAQLTQLTRLQWSHTPGLTQQGVGHLTALQGLKELSVWDCGLSQQFMGSFEGALDLRQDERSCFEVGAGVGGCW